MRKSGESLSVDRAGGLTLSREEAGAGLADDLGIEPKVGLIVMMCLGLAAALGAGSILWLAYGPATGLLGGASAGLGVGLVAVVVTAVVGGLKHRRVSEQDLREPYAVLKRTARSALFAFLAFVFMGLLILIPVFLVGFGSTLLPSIDPGVHTKLAVGVSIGSGLLLSLGLRVALKYGGAAVLHYSEGQLALIQSGTLLLLDEATKRVLLYREGRAYAFVAPLLGKYFARVYRRRSTKTQSKAGRRKASP